MESLPDDLYSRIVTLGTYSFPHRSMPEQREAKAKLHQVLTNGTIQELPEALRKHGHSWIKNVKGQYIHGENWVSDTAYELAREVQFVINALKKSRAA